MYLWRKTRNFRAEDMLLVAASGNMSAIECRYLIDDMSWPSV